MNKMLKTMLAVSPLLLMAACGGGDDDFDDRADIADPKVRVVHAVPLGPDVSLLRNNVAVPNTNTSYKGATPYFDVESGDATWLVRTTAAPNASIGQVQFNASRGNKFTLVAVPGTGSLTDVVLISDPYNKSLTSDDARVRVLHASFNASNIDAYITRPNVAITGVNPNFGNVAYKQANPASGNDSLEFDGDDPAYVLTLTAAGSKTPVFRAPISLGENADWLLTVLPDSVAPNDVKVLLVKSDDSAPAQEIANTL